MPDAGSGWSGERRGNRPVVDVLTRGHVARALCREGNAVGGGNSARVRGGKYGERGGSQEAAPRESRRTHDMLHFS
ncbi:hypothetical protein AMIS_66470 [Actinoplanes missouriensis 431]|uniref:Uncharacterized protein n=1 Tax=Actinoplanes missouriensis (strain ATCC 14538 / DSM 43046 / CBS 188.64 / JCM 3121 / NBRC 102363 / NCIMB 12654 / NRRL B-3342 / UNCC 431) TaxID=512565 RepID=I0HFT0_ACTM4|nr:hypothetical protein AMIS_66470 [Actinoplanes missouriensis 431]